MPLLAVDVGAGTQDILLLQENIPLEGSIKLILPSQTVIVAERINRARLKGKDIFLYGSTMGGGACSAAVRWHLAAGLKVYATPTAAATINDNLDRVESLGIMIREDAPDNSEVIEMGDIDIPALHQVFDIFGLNIPTEVAVAVQDHGYSPSRSNRLVRFEYLKEAIRAGGKLEAFAYRHPPEIMTRMIAVQNYLIEYGLSSTLMDTGPAAIFGASLDPRCQEPVLVINFGNGHTVAALIKEGGICAVFEHHTSQLNPDKLRMLVNRLCNGSLENSEVFNDGGHGAYIRDVPDHIESILVTGPRREPFLKSGIFQDAMAASPGGDMMITGCIGLINAWQKREDLWR